MSILPHDAHSMPSRTFPLSRQRRRRTTLAGETAGPSAGARPAGPRLPHEHDENADTPRAPTAPIIQAEADLAEGRQDTDLRGRAREVFDKANAKRR
jgi:hypothetical protein